MNGEISFATALPADVPRPPGLGEGVRWPDGVVRPPGEFPGATEQAGAGPPQPELLHLDTAGREALFAIARRAVPVALAVGGVSLAAVLARRRRRG